MNPFAGVLIHAIGAVCAASFYVPLKKVKSWAWESYYLAHGIMAWTILPIIVALIFTPDLVRIITSAPGRTLAITFGFGFLWGVGALTFGLSMRYLGLSLGYALALGCCAAFGTLLPPIFKGEILSFFTVPSKMVIMAGIIVSLLGIAVCGLAGLRKERELTDNQKKESVQEFHLVKGIIVAVLSGIMAACFALGLDSGREIANIAMEIGTGVIHQNSPVFVVVMAGGFCTNLAWCLLLNIKNKTLGDYAKGPATLLTRNYLLTALAGLLWYAQFFFYGIANTKMGEYGFTSWSIHMALIIAFSNFWGICMKEWKSVSRKTWITLWLGIITLVLSAVLIGYGNYLA